METETKMEMAVSKTEAAAAAAAAATAAATTRRRKGCQEKTNLDTFEKFGRYTSIEFFVLKKFEKIMKKIYWSIVEISCRCRQSSKKF